MPSEYLLPPSWESPDHCFDCHRSPVAKSSRCRRASRNRGGPGSSKSGTPGAGPARRAGDAAHAGGRSLAAGTVFVFLSSECPISREYVPELNRLAKAAGRTKSAFTASFRSKRHAAAAEKFADEFQLAFPLLFDGSDELAAPVPSKELPRSLSRRPGRSRAIPRPDRRFLRRYRQKKGSAHPPRSARRHDRHRGRPTDRRPGNRAIGCPFEGSTTVPENRR